jgi:hypothetical protein
MGIHDVEMHRRLTHLVPIFAFNIDRINKCKPLHT